MKKMPVLKFWSFYYFDEDRIDALQNENRHKATRESAIYYAGDYEFTLVTIEVCKVKIYPKKPGGYLRV